MKRYAVIDLGTNTFHLIIVERNKTGQFEQLHRERIFVRLAENGIAKIGKAPFQRGIEAIQQFQKTLILHPVENIKAFGTAALRTASNAADFIAEIQSTTGIKVDIIPGQEEARLIYLGVKKAVDFHQYSDLIMDVGGGSVEFIIANEDGVQWAESFPIGVAVLYNEFHESDPIAAADIHALHSFLTQTLAPLEKALQGFQVKRLIGASGTFDVLETNLAEASQKPNMATIPVDRFHPLQELIVQMTLEERKQSKQLPISRADMIVVALLLIKQIVQLAKPNEIIVSSFAMKEGMLGEF